LFISSKLSAKKLGKRYSRAYALVARAKPIDLATMVFTETQTKTHDQSLKEIIDTLKAYPKNTNPSRKRWIKYWKALTNSKR